MGKRHKEMRGVIALIGQKVMVYVSVMIPALKLLAHLPALAIAPLVHLPQSHSPS